VVNHKSKTMNLHLILPQLLSLITMMLPAAAVSPSHNHGLPARHMEHNSNIVLVPTKKQHLETPNHYHVSGRNITELYGHTLSIIADEVNLLRVTFPSVNTTLERLLEVEEAKVEDPKQARPLLSIATFGLFVGTLFGRRVLRRRNSFWRKKMEYELASDIVYSITPSDVDYGSFRTLWTGDLEKFDV